MLTNTPDEEALIKRAMDVLSTNLGPADAFRFLSLKSQGRLDAVKRHQHWQSSVDPESFFNALFKGGESAAPI